MSCTTVSKLAKQNARQRLIDDGLIDKYNNILDRNGLIRRMHEFDAYAKREHGIDAKMVRFEDIDRSNKVIFNTAAFRAIDIMRGKVPHDLADENTNSYLRQVSPNYSPAFNPEDFFTGDDYVNFGNPRGTGSTSNDNIPSNGLARVVGLKESLLLRAKKAYTEIKPQLKDAKADPAEYNRLLDKQSKLKDYIFGNEAKNIKGLESEISDINKLDSRSPEIIAPYINKEIGRLDTLVKSSDPNHTAEARDIIDFIKSMADFNAVNIARSPNGHPLYDIKELYDGEGNFLLNPTMAKPYKDWADIATQYEDKLAIQSRNIMENTFNNNQKIRDLYNKNFTYDDIVNAKKGLKDIQWLDMMVMDISSGIFSHSGQMPQVIKNLVDNAFEKHASWSKEVEEHTDALLPKVQAELKTLGYTLNRLGFMGINGVSYDLFRQAMPDETQYNNNIANKYSYTFLEKQEQMQDRFGNLLKDAYATTDPTARNLKFRKAYESRNKFLRDNTQHIDPSLISKITSNPAFESLNSRFTHTPEEIANHENNLKNIVGEDHYNKIVESQESKLRDYVAQRQNTLDGILQEEGVQSESDLTDRGLKQLQAWEAINSPFKGLDYLNDRQPTRIGTSDFHSNLDYNEFVPLREKGGKDLGNYDKNYAIIEKNPVLKQFHDLLTKTLSDMYERFDYDEQQKLDFNSVPNLQKSMIEILLDKNLSFYQAISEVFRRIIDKLKGSFGIHPQNATSFAQINPNTGLPDYKVNDTFIKQNNKAIEDNFNLKLIKLNHTYNTTGNRIGKFTSFSDRELTPDRVSMINQFTGRPFSREELIATYGKSVPIGKIIYNAAQHEVAQGMSFDLPKIMKLYADLTSQYSARKEMLPMVDLMKNHYEGIKNQVTNNTGDPKINNETGNNQLNGLRTNAIKQFDNWFQRVVLGNQNLKKQYGVMKPSAKMDTQEQSSFLNQFFSHIANATSFDGKIYDHKEKEMVSQIDTMLGKLGDSEEDKETTKELERIKGSLGKQAALSATVDNIFNYVRFKGLGFNLSSGITNFIEGQVANSITASSGMYFPHELIDTITPSEMIASDITKQFNRGNMSEKVAKAYYMAKRMDVLQDNSNDLQKASAQSAFSNLNKFNPYYELQKGEQYNQIPLMAATLKNHEITGKDGQKSNIWDELSGHYDKDTKQWEFHLNPGFDTHENKKSWEEFNGDDYFNYKTKIRQIIKNTHGDFDPTSGMMAKSYQAGQAALMFKTWLPREFYKRFATPQDDIHAGIEGFKGRYLSHTAATAAMHGGLVGAYFLGPLGAGIGATAGGLLGHFYGAESQMGLMKELLYANKVLFKKMAGMPVNFISRRFGQGDLIDTKINQSENSKFNFSQQDFNNFKGNMQEMAIQAAYLGLLFMTKAIFWDDKDKPNDPRRMMHNLLANRLMQIAGTSMMYMNTVETGTTVLTIPVLKFFQNTGKTISAAEKFMEGKDTYTAGPYAGHSKLWTNFQKTFIPGVGSSSYAGFGGQMKQQFANSPYDDYFHNDETKTKQQYKQARAERRLELDQSLQESIPDDDMRHTQVTKQLNKEFPKQKSSHHAIGALLSK